MNGTNFFQTLESRTMMSTVAPSTGDHGALTRTTPSTRVEQELLPGGGATVDTSNGTGNSTGTLGANARRRFISELIRVD